MSGPEHQDVAEQVGERAVHDRLRLDRDPAIAPKAKQVKSAESGGVLILLADGLFQDFYLDMTGFLGDLAGGHPLAAEGVKCVQQPHREGARTSHPGGRRQVSDRTDENRRLDIEKSETLAGNVVLDLGDRVDLLGARVVYPYRLVEDLAVALNGDVNVFVDSRAQYGAFYDPEEIGQIGPAARETDAQGRSGDDDVSRAGPAMRRLPPLVLECCGRV